MGRQALRLMFVGMAILARSWLCANDEPVTLPLPNHSFEVLDGRSGLPVGWTPWNATRNLTTFTLARAKTGVASAAVTDDSPVESQGLRSPRVPIKGGRSYLARCYVWIESLQAGGFSLYLEFWRHDERLASQAVSTSEQGQWALLSVRETAPQEANAVTVLIYASSATIGQAFFDDVSLQAITP